MQKHELAQWLLSADRRGDAAYGAAQRRQDDGKAATGRRVQDRAARRKVPCFRVSGMSLSSGSPCLAA